MAKSDDLIKYITERVVTYIDTPRDVRREKRKLVKRRKEHWAVRWFGMVPFSIRMWVDRQKERRAKKRTPPS